jgi:hypothetical protein
MLDAHWKLTKTIDIPNWEGIRDYVSIYKRLPLSEQEEPRPYGVWEDDDPMDDSQKLREALGQIESLKEELARAKQGGHTEERLILALKEGKLTNERCLAEIVELRSRNASLKQTNKMLCVQVDLLAETNEVHRQQLEKAGVEAKHRREPVVSLDAQEIERRAPHAFGIKSSAYYFDPIAQLKDKQERHERLAQEARDALQRHQVDTDSKTPHIKR